jgi:glutamine amidotransferase
MWAFNWCFCHNGQVPLFEDHPDHFLGDVAGERFYYPIGNTDSEATFCSILNALRAEYRENMPTLAVLYDKLQSLCQEIVDYDPKGTILNFLMTCGPHVLWVYSWPGRRPGSEVWNGLHYTVRSNSTFMHDQDLSVDVSLAGRADDSVAIVATAPLTDDEEWIELKPGELILLDEGIPRVTPKELFRVELSGHGLNNNGKALKPPPLEEDMRRYQFQPDFFVGGGI